jgi:hypothetical protein
MSQPTAPTPPSENYGSDSLNVDIVLADDRGGTTLLPADPDVLAAYLAECRKLERRSSAKKKKPRGKG